MGLVRSSGFVVFVSVHVWSALAIQTWHGEPRNDAMDSISGILESVKVSADMGVNEQAVRASKVIRGLAKVPAPDAPFKQTFIDPQPAIGSGSCQRDFKAFCPVGFVEVGHVTAGETHGCAPNMEYTGPCTGIVGFSGKSDKAKARFSDQCHAYWPCTSCPRDYGACPGNWESVSGSCAPDNSYDGPCSATDFTSYTAIMFEEWSSKCSVFWPCAQQSA